MSRMNRFQWLQRQARCHIANRHDRRLRVEPLEDRRLLATFTVSNLLDGAVAAPGDLPGSLRQAIYDANNTAGADTINFTSGPGTISLSAGQLTISDDVTLTGLGADRLTIDAGGGSGVLSITSGNVTVDGLTITGGSALTGGGIFAAAGTTTSLDALVITGNTATNGAVLAGGGIANLGTMTITGSTISGNMAPMGNAWGGGILNYTGTLTMTNSTISGNTSAFAGGGLRNFNGGSYLYHNTFYGNSTGALGGGISQNSGVVVLGHNLISGNTAVNGSDVMRSGGAIVVNDYNLFGDNSIVTGQSVGGFGPGGTDITATNGGSNPTALASILDTSLADNGGPTPTHALVTGSPAIDAGNTTALANDQRGVPFVRESGTIDIGAFEVQSLALVVDTLTDESDGDYSTNDLSLREALELTNINTGADTITFDSGLAGTIILQAALGELVISDDVTVTGPGADVLAIDATGSRVLNITDGTVDISGLTFTGGIEERGGGIRNGVSAVTTLTAVAVTNNTATRDSNGAGGGIYNFGDITIVDSTVSNNTASNDFAYGGGIYSYGPATITGSTISGNSAGVGAGVTSDSGTTTITGSTITGNSVDYFGGGVLSRGTATITIASSLVSGNTAPDGGTAVMRVAGTINLNANNLLGDISKSTGDAVVGVSAGASDITATSNGTDPTALASILNTTLAYNGGPTLTHALVAGSPAVDAGSSVETHDQRGAPFARDDGNGVDIGAYELQTLNLVVDTLTDESDGDYSALDLSLREALELTNANPGADTITFDGSLSGTINLDPANGQLTINDDVTVTGLGAGQLTIDAGGNSRVMRVTGTTTADISGLTLTGGSEDRGGGLRNYANATTTLTGVVITGNTATTATNDAGGGIWNTGDLTLVESTVSNNMAPSGRGGGAWSNSQLTLTGSTISGNSASSGNGGGIANGGTATLSITGSTISDNTAISGGGIVNLGTLNVTTSTVSGNMAVSNSGGIYNALGTATILNSTISGNTAKFGGGFGTFYGTLNIAHSTVTGNVALSGGSGGGLRLILNQGSTTLSHTIVSGNNGPQLGADEISLSGGAITLDDYNLLGDSSKNNANAFSGFSVPVGTDITATSDGTNPTALADILDTSLSDNGGPTLTHALVAGSPAIDAGNPAVVSPPANDQRGAPFVRESGTIDIGTYEVQSLALVVDTLDDESDGDYSALDLSLREAIEQANANPGADTITFNALLNGGSIAMVDALGAMFITDEVVIDATSLASGLTVDAGDGPDNTFNTGDGDRIFFLDDSDAGNVMQVAISGLTLTGADTPGNGGAILNREDLTLTASTVTGNAAQFGGGGIISYESLTVAGSTFTLNHAQSNATAGGGAIRAHQSAQVTISDTLISGNTAAGRGGGLYIDIDPGGTFDLLRSTLDNNTADDRGGGLRLLSEGQTTIDSSTISGNHSGVHGGGAYLGNYPAGTTLIINTTVSGNTAYGNGGGLLLGRNITIENSTISGNQADSNNTNYGNGGGIYARIGTVSLANTIVANNTDLSTASLNDVGIHGSGIVTASYSLIEVDPGGIGGANNLFGVDPQLGPLQNNGGPTLTHALLPGSPAIDEGDPLFASPPTNDQRGALFVRESGTIDIGAYEVQSLSLVVDTLTDESDGDYSALDLSLREAIELTNTNPGADTITFAVTGTINMDDALGEMAITDAVTISGPGANQLTIDAGDGTDNTFNTGDGYRIFNINDGTGALLDVEISGLTLTGGDEIGVGGGAILNRENLTLSSSTVSSNSTRDEGGGIVSSGPLTVTDSTISGNSAISDGGGIDSSGSTLTITGSTISGNSAGDGGGLFKRFGSSTITDSTVSGNTSYSQGGGIFLNSGTLTITDSTISGNSTDLFDGGGIFANQSTLNITSSTITANSAAGGSGGGGISQANTTSTITSSTISGNSAAIRGGGLHNRNGTANIQFSTITGNSAGTSGGGLQAYDYFGTATVNVTSSIISGNTAPTGSESSVYYGPLGGSYGGAVNLNDYNLIGDSSKTTAQALDGVTAGASDITATSNGTNPTALAAILDTTLADNGGPTLTHALVGGSPAIDAGDLGVSSPPDYDQRGFAFDRIVGGQIDIGAVESGAVSADFDLDGVVSGFDFLKWQLGFGTTGTAVHGDGDANIDSDVDNADLDVWELQYGTAAPLVAAVSDQPSAISSQLSAPSAVLVDAAMALGMAGDTPEQEPAQLLEANSAEEPATASDEVGQPVAVSQQSEDSFSSDGSSEEQEEQDAWLSDELLESVFG